MMHRWVLVPRYPEAVARAEGECWYLGARTQEAKRMQGAERYLSWRVAHCPAGITSPMASHGDRLTECASSMAEWDRGAVAEMPRWTAPPNGNPGLLSRTVFVRELPDYALLRQASKLP
jgi:hypothetical protein